MLIELDAATDEEVFAQGGAFAVGNGCGADAPPDAGLLLQDIEDLHECRQILAFQERTRDLGIPDGLIAGEAGRISATSGVIDIR